MDVAAWCGHCGQSFRLVEVIEDGNAGSCPRCAHVFAPAYAAVVASAVRQLVLAAGALSAAGSQLAEVAATLHVDRRKLYADLDRALDR